MKPLPIVSQTYNVYDDGKIKKSRKYTVTVKEVTSFKKIDKPTLQNWQKEVKRYYWLYASKTDYFIKTINKSGEEEIFVRTKDGRWFGIGSFLNAGLLDVDGKLTQSINNKQ